MSYGLFVFSVCISRNPKDTDHQLVSFGVVKYFMDVFIYSLGEWFSSELYDLMLIDNCLLSGYLFSLYNVGSLAAS